MSMQWPRFYIWQNRLSKFIDYPLAIVPFVKKRLYYNSRADSYVSYYKNTTFLSYQETIDELITKNRSIVRFGDDVFDMLLGIGLYFNDWHQRYDSTLAARLKEVLASREEKLLVCFNPEFILKTKAEFEVEGIGEQHQFWTHSKVFLKDYLQSNQTYGSALCFQERYNEALDYEKILHYLSQKHLVIVASNTARFAKQKFGTTTDYIEGPSSDAWFSYDKIMSEVKATVGKYKKEDVLIMISLGPTSKIMSLDLSRAGYTVWDTGQFFDLALKRLSE